MKKFLDLKRNIIDSKNSPTIIQTYLDSIRSSCYKLANPHISPRTNSRQKNTPILLMDSCNNTKTKKHSLNQKQSPLRKVQVFDFLSQKQSQQNDNVPLVSYRDKEIIQSRNNQQTHSFVQKQPTNKINSQIPQQIDCIMQQLSTRCNEKLQKQINTQQQIIEIILQNLQKLEKKKQFQVSIKLVKNIILSMGKGQNKQFTKISNHMEDRQQSLYIRDRRQQQEQDTSRNQSHFKSCIKVFEDDDLQQRQMGISKNKKINKQLAAQLIWQRQPKPNLDKQGRSIYIQDQNIQQQSFYPSLYQSQQNQLAQTSRNSIQQHQKQQNSMQEQQQLQGCQKQLYCIEELQEQQDKKSSNKFISIVQIPEQNIQFRKIKYILDSSTMKKKNLVQHQDSPLFDRQQIIRYNLKNNHHLSTKSLYVNHAQPEVQLKPTKSQFNRTYTFQSQSQNSPQTMKTHKSTYSSSHLSYVQLLSQHSKGSTKNINPNKQKNQYPKQPKNYINQNKFKKMEKTLQFSKKNKQTKAQKTKQLKQIVNMLSNKYNLTVKLTRK